MVASALSQPWRRCRGLTLLELLVVLSLLALGSAGVVWRLYDPVARQLQQEATRLAAVLEAGRSQSRARGQALRWHTTPEGYAFEGFALDLARGLAGSARWLYQTTQAQVWDADAVLLGPEPVIGRQAVAIAHGPSGRSIWVLTDGVRPFEVRWPAAASGSNQG